MTEPEMPGVEPESVRKVMGGDTRVGRTIKVEVSDETHGGVVEGYVTGNLDPGGELKEVFLAGFGKEGSTLDGWTQFAAILLSLGLQAGVDFGAVATRTAAMKFEPYGRTDDPEIPWAPSVPAYIMVRLALTFGDEDAKAAVHAEMAEWRNE